ncbi:hypothetical protein NGRA_0161 [Nosema granulosis]|uniref:Uncharacterized protein n=1 Tax=Nosema granulosis TaxID=83296 RepID=A0A9P6H1D9_9MICR|nr:hypothetical protein NGRA_0161 [Nosema granulosis]
MVTKEIIRRANKLSKTKLSGKNTIKAINEYSLSLINFYTGVLNLEPEIYNKIDDEIRQTLVHNVIHLQPSCKKRLYLQHNELERGLVNVEHRSELMLVKLLDDFMKTSLVHKRRAAILKSQKEDKTHLWLIKKFCGEKYNIAGEIDVSMFTDAQKSLCTTN